MSGSRDNAESAPESPKSKGSVPASSSSLTTEPRRMSSPLPCTRNHISLYRKVDVALYTHLLQLLHQQARRIAKLLEDVEHRELLSVASSRAVEDVAHGVPLDDLGVDGELNLSRHDEDGVLDCGTGKKQGGQLSAEREAGERAHAWEGGTLR